ncbi:hypothetical protein COB57_00605 [Candidatus Peregrinibacteria bacterium]|nr:MAG: hypothetical protein COB57_00605 [Candidatus Peregrinibacteria bacterium]
MGTSKVSSLVLHSLTEAIAQFSADNIDDFFKQFCKLVYIITHTEPKFGILNYQFQHLMQEIKKEVNKSKNQKNWKKIVLDTINIFHKEAKQERKQLLKSSEEIKVNKKTILIHDHSNTVLNVLKHLKRKKQEFHIIISEQDYEKTHDNIEQLHEEGISFEVVPSYMLSVMHDKIDMVFFGGLTLKDDMNFVMDPGTYGIISEFHSINIPVYMFMNTAKFSLWKSAPRGEIFTQTHKRKHVSKDITYNRIKCSHDRVPSYFFHKIITNEGVLSNEQLKTLFLVKLEDYGHLHTEECKKHI